MKILVAGATGFIGKSLVPELKSKGHELVLLSRSFRSSADHNVRYRTWDGKTLGTWAEELETVDAVINLAGAAIAEKRWSKRQKENIVDSRIQATRAIVQAIEKAKRKTRILINASAVGYYGDVPEGNVTESTPKGKGFLADTCGQWENEARVAEKWGVRTVFLRTGMVLGEGGGVLSKMIPPFQFFVGGPPGSGRQWISWIHREDVVGILLYVLGNPSISGPINATAPNPVTLRDFCRTLGKALKRPSWVSVPAFALKFILGEMSDMLLGGQKAVPQKLLDQGYRFKFSDLQKALMDILPKRNTPIDR